MIELIRVEPLEIPADVAWLISATQQIAMKDFYMYVHKDGKMYVNKSVPEKDIKKMIEVMEFPGHFITDDDTELGQFMNYIYDTYGWATYNAMFEYHTHKIREQEKQEAKEKIQSAIPSIEKMIDKGMYNEDMVYEALSAGHDRKGKPSKNRCGYSDIYAYCLGYLVGSGALKEEHHPEDSGNVIDFYYGISEMLEHIDIQEMPRIYGYLKEMYFPEQTQKGGKE